MAGSVEGQVAIVTGGAAGIGGATARRLAEEGASVVIVDVNGEAARQNVDKIRGAGGTADTFIGDVGKHDDIHAMVEYAVERFGKLTILINNAYGPVGEGVRGSAVDVTEEGWDRGLAVLVKSIFLAAKYAVPHIQRAGGGSIVSTASVHGLLMSPNALVYEAGKSAVIGVTRQMACDFGPLGIRVNCICPGHIITERMAERWGDNESGQRFFDQQYPVRRTGTPLDIANAMLFLCSEQASFITGHTLVVDGGMTVQLQENLGVHLAHYMHEHPETQLPY